MRSPISSVRESRRLTSGFSLIELLIVLAISLIATVVAIPLIGNTVAQYRLRSSAVDLDAFLQRARVTSLRDNRTYNVRTAPDTSGGFTYTRVYVDVNSNGLWDPLPPAGPEPSIELQRDITLAAPGTPVSNATLGFAPQTISTAVPAGFNSRGLPCFNNPCSSSVLVGGVPTQVGYVYYLRYGTGAASRWAAISISPSGRMRSWSYSGSTWSY